jgi:DNA repair protein RecN (Recombination protein N)
LLVELAITDFAIIEALRLRFAPGFSVLTGETGAGKSILIDAVSLLLGGRASPDVVRTGCEQAAVEGVFALAEDSLSALIPLLTEYGLYDDANELILRREISRTRRAMCRINGRAVTLNVLQEIGRHLIDIHGQGDHLSLLQVRHHLDFLDRYGGLMANREAFGAQVRALREIRQEMAALRRDERELARRVDLLTFQAHEIESARLTPGEEDELRRQRHLLANAEKRMQLAAEAFALLVEGRQGQRSATDVLGDVVEQVGSLARLDETLAGESSRLEDLLYQMEDLGRALRRYRDGIEYDQRGLEAVEERLDLINNLKRKYGDSIEDVLAFATKAQAELEGISHSEERMAALQEQEAVLLREMAAQGAQLSQQRRAAAERLNQHIERELAELNMEGARFLVDMRHEPDPEGVELDGARCAFGPTGLDQAEFLIAPNLGEEPKPLARIASGGETSRLMLAMKTALSSIDPVPTLIFDEVDAGIGGRTGGIVGRKLWRLAQDHQVFCVTHLAQIAAFGTVHFNIAKATVGERTLSVAHQLTHDERVDEIAVMLSGAATETSRENARELLGAAPSLSE